MIHLTTSDIEALSTEKRLHLINGITGVKPANLVGSQDNNGVPNLAIYSSVVHIGSLPPLIGFFQRVQNEKDQDTYKNILQTENYTLNQVSQSFYKNAHQTSANYDNAISEFETCGLSPEYLFDFKAPFVKESALKYIR